MRLDKYLKVSRIIKRRSVAKGISDLGFVKINGKEAKPATNVKVDDIVELSLGERIVKIRVLKVPVSLKKEDAKETYEVIGEEWKSN